MNGLRHRGLRLHLQPRPRAATAIATFSGAPPRPLERFSAKSFVIRKSPCDFLLTKPNPIEDEGSSSMPEDSSSTRQGDNFPEQKFWPRIVRTLAVTGKALERVEEREN